jgi:endonuclease/exonuclease/phosphatase family metal-dependent hydrolase
MQAAADTLRVAVVVVAGRGAQMAEFSYVSWNVKHFSIRIEKTPGERSTSWTSFNPANNTRVSKMMADIIEAKYSADVVGVMEGVQTASVVDQAAAELKSCLTAGGWTSQSSELSVTTTSTKRLKTDTGKKSNDAVLRRADRYVVFWRNDKASRAKVSKMELAPRDLSADGRKRKLDFEDRSPLRFVVDADAKQALVFLWHAPQPKHTQGAKTIDRLAEWIAQSQKTFKIDSVLASGDFNLDTGSTAFDPLTTHASMQGLFDSLLTTLGKDTDTRFRDYMKGNLEKAFLNEAFDNIFVKNLTCNSQTLVNLGEWACTFIKTSNKITLSCITRGFFSDAVRLGNMISDHCPVGVTVDIP